MTVMNHSIMNVRKTFNQIKTIKNVITELLLIVQSINHFCSQYARSVVEVAVLTVMSKVR